MTLSAFAENNPNNPLLNIMNYNDNHFYNSYGDFLPKSESDSSILFDFGSTMKIDLYSYFIRSNDHSPSAHYHSMTWRVEGSNDKSHWTQLDRREKDPALNGSYK